MLRTILFFCFISLFFLIAPQHTTAQSDIGTEYVRIKTKDGSVFKGKIISRDDGDITLETAYGETTVKQTEIDKITFVEMAEDGEEQMDNNHSGSHYLLSNSGYGLQKGESYYENIYVFWNSYSIGLSDNFSISTGGEIASLLFAQRVPIIFVTPKLSVPFKGGAVSLSTSLFTSPEDNFEAFGFLQGAVTLGSRSNNITLSVATGMNFNDGFVDTYPMTLSGMYSLSPRLTMISENWFIRESSNNLGLISLGLRIHSKGNRKTFLTAALYRPTEGGIGILALPFISGTVAIK